MFLKKKTVLVTGLLLLVVATVYVRYKDSLPPRSPHKVARVLSGLAIPGSARVVAFEEEWNEFNGDGFCFVVLRLDDHLFETVYQEAKAKGYAELSLKAPVYGPLQAIPDSKTVGIYQLTTEDQDPTSFTGAVLSRADRLVSVYIAVN